MELIQSLYDEGRFLTAWRESRKLGPLRQWQDAVLAGRLAGQLGHPRLRSHIHLRNFRTQSAPGAEDTLFYLYALDTVQGPLAAWEELRRRGPGLPHATARTQADWYAFHAVTLAHLRDFSRAERWQRRAEDLAGEEPWIRCVRADLLHLRGAYEEARSVLEGTLRERPNHPSSCQRMSHFLQAVGKDDEAEAFLKRKDRELECCWISVDLISLLGDLGRISEVEPWCARYEELAPLRASEMRRWLNRQRGEAAYARGDRPRAIGFFRDLSPFHKRVVERLEKNETTRRVELKVPFVRQRHMTCAPASIASLTHYFGRPADHAELSRAICYDGTTDYRERGWLEAQGWRTREFRVTWESARLLLDASLPFLLTTVAAGNAHAQAVVGYDEARRSLILNDPTVRITEMLEEGLEAQVAWGPRGVVFVPADHPALPALPDEELYDRLYQLLRALDEHRRDEAQQALESLPEDHPLTLQARVRLAWYDGDRASALAVTRARAERFPQDDALSFQLLGQLQSQSCHTEFFALLQRHARKDLALGFMLGRLLARDSRQHRQARRWLRLGRAPAASVCTGLADLCWNSQLAGEAAEYSRLASCLEEHDEARALLFFERASAAGREEEALDYLRDRFERLGALSGEPAVTLLEALSRTGRHGELFELLERARSLRPDDAELALAEVRARFQHGRTDEARTLLEEVRGRVAPGAWLTAAAQLEEQCGDLKRALELWRERLRSERTETDAHEEVARLVALLEGPEKAVEHLREAVAQHPRHVGLRMSLVSRLRHLNQGEAEVRELLSLSPANAWAWRALALQLSRQGKHQPARAALEEATALEPGSPSQWEVRGVLLQRAGDLEGARQAYREYLQLTAENPTVLEKLLEVSPVPRQDLAFCLEWLERRPSGPLVTTWREQAGRFLERREVIDGLLRLQSAAPDCAECWTALVHEYDLAGEVERRDLTAAEATARFPLRAEVHQELARMHMTARRWDEACQRLERAVELSRGALELTRMLAEAHKLAGRQSVARQLLEEGLARAPFDAYCLADLAEVVWEDDQEAAVDLVVRSLQTEPTYGWSWSTLCEWRPERALEVGRELVERRPADADLWVRLAEVSAPEEALRCLEQALTLTPTHVNAHDQRVEALAQAGRLDEARAALHAPVWKGQLPSRLQGREAWLLALSGDHAGASARMARLLEDEPAYRWGWLHQLAWLDEHGPLPAYRAAGERMIELFPNEVHGWIARGDARLRLEDQGGLDDLRRALELDGHQQWAAVTLLEAAFKANDLKEVDRLLDRVQIERMQNWFRLRLASRLRLLDSVREELVRLAALGPEGLEEMVQLLGHDGWTWADLGPALEEGLRRHPGFEVAGCWLRSLTNRWDETRVMALPDEAFAFAGPLFVERLPGLPDLRALIGRQRERLRSVSRVWAQTGAMLVKFNRFAEAVEWMHDYATRPDIEGWMLANLVQAHHLLGRGAQAVAVGEWAAARVDDDDLTLAILALEEALAGRRDEASAWLARVPPQRDPYPQALVLYAEALLSDAPWPKVRAARQLVPEGVSVRRRVVGALARRGRWLRAAWEWI